MQQQEHGDFIMNNYKVHICQAWLEGKCSESKISCFNSHNKTPIRRRAVRLPIRFNYVAKMCIKKCKDRENCRFAHNMLEVMFHPSVFRTLMCQHDYVNGVCVKNGRTCAFAHFPEQLRVGIAESTPANLEYCPGELEMIEHYKVHPCEGFPFRCACNGFCYHTDTERRRKGVINYLPFPCQNIKPSKKQYWSSNPENDSECHSICPDDCREGAWNCLYCHTYVEMMYHPDNFRTKMCTSPFCIFGNFCAHAHSVTELRKIL